MEDDRARASSPETPAAELRRLAGSNGELAALVAANPNAPGDLLVALLGQSADIVLRNPSFHLHLLTDPMPESIEEEQCLGLVRCPLTPPALLEVVLRFGVLCSDLDTILALLAHPACSPQLLAGLSRSDLDEARYLIARRPDIPGETARRLCFDVHHDVRQRAACHPALSADFRARLRRLAQGEQEHLNGEERSWLAEQQQKRAELEEQGQQQEPERSLHLGPWQTLPPGMLQRMAGSSMAAVRQDAADHPATPAHALWLCVGDEEEPIRLAARGNPSLLASDRALLERLGIDIQAPEPHAPRRATEAELRHLLEGGPWLGGCAACSPDLPDALREEIASGEAPLPRLMLASRGDLPLVLVRRMLRHGWSALDFEIRQKIARHQTLDEAIYQELRKPENLDALVENPSLLALHPELLRYETPGQEKPTRGELLRLTLLSEELHETDRVKAAAHPDAPEAMLEALARDPSDVVKKEVARHPRCPGSALELMAGHPWFFLRSIVAQHPRCPGWLLRQLALDADPAVASVARARVLTSETE